MSYNDISLYAVGRGPGSFSGMRMSFAVAQALALPSKAEVRAVSSGAALALQVAQASLPAHGQTGMSAPREIAVVGDARRGQVWIGLFSVDATSPSRLQLSKDWKLVPYDEVSVPEGAIVVSPEAERLTEIFPTISSRRSPLAKADGTCDASGVNARFPHAKEVAELAQAGSEELEPLYMHPPVFIEPKYA